MLLFILIPCFIFLSFEIFIFFYGKKTSKKIGNYIIVLGAGLHGDKLSISLKNRLDTALKLHHLSPSTPLIVSGGQGKDELVSEAYAMKKYLVQQGIPSTLIHMEDQSTTTYENFILSKQKIQLLDNNASLHVNVITNRFHMFRSWYLCRKVGFTCYSYPAPDATNIKTCKYYIREFFAFIKILLFHP